jgi:hypothetical protein
LFAICITSIDGKKAAWLLDLFFAKHSRVVEWTKFFPEISFSGDVAESERWLVHDAADGANLRAGLYGRESLATSLGRF